MKKVFVSGCYDIIHGGHIEFFKQARLLGDYLIVNFASDYIYEIHKGRKSSIPESHKRRVLESIKYIDEVYMSNSSSDSVFDFKESFISSGADILVSTIDDIHFEKKRIFCESIGKEYIRIDKSLDFVPISTTEIRRNLTTPLEVPLRVDFVGGWLDVPLHSIDGGYIINCTITPKVSLRDWSYHKFSGLGGSAAHSILNGVDSFSRELGMGVGWQDPAVILETGLCVWRSGVVPVLEMKLNPDFLNSKMALYWTGIEHRSNDCVNIERDYIGIFNNSKDAYRAICSKDIYGLCNSVNNSYLLQLKEGMCELPTMNELAKKYCGSGHGGYALYIFEREEKRNKFLLNDNAIKIEPYINNTGGA